MFSTTARWCAGGQEKAFMQRAQVLAARERGWGRALWACARWVGEGGVKDHRLGGDAIQIGRIWGSGHLGAERG